MWPWKLGPLPEIHSFYYGSVLAKPISQSMVWCLEAQESSARDNGGTSLSLHDANFRVSQTREHEDGEHEAGTVPN